MEELHAATKFLEHAFQRYLDACLAIANDNPPSIHNVQQSLASIANGQGLVFSYQHKIKKAKAYISRHRNSFPEIVPINVLPGEILTRIFYLAMHMQPCCFEYPVTSEVDLPPYAKTLSQVSTRWHQIAVQSSGLWSHIDLAPLGIFQRKLTTRGKISASRSGQLPLDVHVVNTSVNRGPRARRAGIDEEFSTLCKSITPRVRSLEFTFASTFGDLGYLVCILQDFFLGSVPGVLTRLALAAKSDMYGLRAPNFVLVPESDSYNVDSRGIKVWRLGMAKLELENILFAVKSLWLDTVFFSWDSWAYHGLVDLHLMSDAGEMTITAKQLANIFTACPELENFHFGLRLKHVFPTAPVQLNNLQRLCLVHPSKGDVLRLIIPGAKPLKIAIFDHTTEAPLSKESAIPRFFARSNITHLYLRELLDLGIHQLLRLLPNLRVLKLEDVQLFPECDENPPTHLQQDVDTLHLASVYIYLENFYDITRRFLEVIIDDPKVLEIGCEWVRGQEALDKLNRNSYQVLKFREASPNMCNYSRHRQFLKHDWDNDNE